MDINKTTHLGTATTLPTLLKVSSGSSIAIFTLKVKEEWINQNGIPQFRYNNFKFEAVGSQVNKIMSLVKPGKRFYIDGYGREEIINGVSETRFRIFHIQEAIDEKEIGFIDGIESALEILEQSGSLEEAKDGIRVLKPF